MHVEKVIENGLIAAGYSTSRRVTDKTKLSNFVKLYGINPETVQKLFDAVQTDALGDKRIVCPEMRNLFMTLYWLRSYDTSDSVLRIFAIGSRVTLRRHTRMWLNALQALCQSTVRSSKLCYDGLR
jgi:hypothetical protein